MNKKKLSLCLNKINNFSNFSNFPKKKIKNNIYPIATEGNIQKNKIKFNYEYNHPDEEEKKINNNNRYINPVMNTEQNLIRSKINDKEEEKNCLVKGMTCIQIIEKGIQYKAIDNKITRSKLNIIVNKSNEKIPKKVCNYYEFEFC